MATFFNQATLSYSGGSVNSNIATGEILEVLSATKTAVVDEYSPNSDVTYVVNIVNSGNIAYTPLTITDNLGTYTAGTASVIPLDYVANSVRYFSNGILQPTPTVTDTSPLVISGITVPASGNVTVVYTTRANAFASPLSDGTITNTAIISGGGITDITVSDTVTAATAPNLAVTKSVSPTTVTENGQITYTFNIQNIGNAEATTTDNVVITDTFNPILSNISVTYNGAAWTEGVNYTYNEATGLFTTIAGQITVPAAAYTQDSVTGTFTTTPGNAVLTVTGTV